MYFGCTDQLTDSQLDKTNVVVVRLYLSTCERRVSKNCSDLSLWLGVQQIDMGQESVFSLSVFLFEPLLPFLHLSSVPGGPVAEAFRPEGDNGFIQNLSRIQLRHC